MRTLHANRHFSTRFRQQENAALVYAVNWAGSSDSAISASEWTSDGGVTIASEANTDHEATATLSASPGRYVVTNKATFADGSVDERSFALYVADQYGYRGWRSDYCH